MAQSPPYRIFKATPMVKGPLYLILQANKQPILQANSPFLQFLVAPQISKFEAGKMIQKFWALLWLDLPPYRVYWGLIGLPTDRAITYL